MRFGRLVVEHAVKQRAGDGQVRWYCSCDCGADTVVTGHHLRIGNVTSCGCYLRDRVSPNLRHGDHGSPEYRCWTHMMSRCYNKNHQQYHNYGKRGIKVCKRWHTYENFLADMGRRPSDKHSLDRKNNDGDYKKRNCRWATQLEQARNKRTTRWITANGVTKPLSEWLEELGVFGSTFSYRIRVGYSTEEALGLKRRRAT